MFIYGENSRSDPRVMCGILARATLERFEKKDEPERFRNVYFDNLIRLLEMYRYGALREHNPQGVLEQDKCPTFDFGLNRKPTLEILDKAFGVAHSAFYPSMDKKQLVTHLRELLEQIRNQGAETLDSGEATNLRYFLQKTKDELEAE